MTSDEIADLIENISFRQLISKQQFDQRTFDFKLQGRSIIWEVRLVFGPTFPFSLPQAVLLNEKLIGEVAHVNSKGVICVEISDSVLIDYHAPVEVTQAFLEQTFKILERYSIRVFKDELHDELEGFTHGEDRINSFYRAGCLTEKLALRVTPSSLSTYNVKPVALAKSAGAIPSRFSNTEELNKHQLINIVHIPLSNPVVPNKVGEPTSRFVSELRQAITEENLKIIKNLLGKPTKKKRRFFILVSMPRTSGERTEFLCEFTSKSQELHPILTDSENWQVKFFLINRLNKEYLLERGGANLSINDKAVAIVGCGSVGSQIAISMTKSGAGTIKLIDGDLLDADNIYRHSLGGRYLNFEPSGTNKVLRQRSKVAALEEEIKVNIPHVNVEAIPSALSLDNVKNILSEVDIVIVAIGNPSISLMLNRCFKEHNINKVIFCWNEPDSYGGHSVALDLDQVCLECTFTGEGDTLPINLVEFGQDISKNLTGCAGVFTPFSYLDSAKTAALAAEQAILYLTSGNMEPKLRSWKGNDKGSLKTTTRYRDMPLMEELSLTNNDECRCCGRNN